MNPGTSEFVVCGDELLIRPVVEMPPGCLVPIVAQASPAGGVCCRGHGLRVEQGDDRGGAVQGATIDAACLAGADGDGAKVKCANSGLGCVSLSGLLNRWLTNTPWSFGTTKKG